MLRAVMKACDVTGLVRSPWGIFRLGKCSSGKNLIGMNPLGRDLLGNITLGKGRIPLRIAMAMSAYDVIGSVKVLSNIKILLFSAFATTMRYTTCTTSL